MLTTAQARMLSEVRATGTRVYNGRARRTVERLAELGLVAYEYDLHAHAKGGGMQLSEAITVRALPVCPGSGRRAATNWLTPICPVCHRGETIGLPRRSRKRLPTVPDHAPNPERCAPPDDY